MTVGNVYFALFGIVSLLGALATVLASPETQKQLADQGMQTKPLMGDKFAAYIRSERAKWAKLVKDVGIPVQ